MLYDNIADAANYKYLGIKESMKRATVKYLQSMG